MTDVETAIIWALNLLERPATMGELEDRLPAMGSKRQTRFTHAFNNLLEAGTVRAVGCNHKSYNHEGDCKVEVAA